MRIGSRRVAAIARGVAAAALALALATPASAQFGGLKKKLKAAAAQEGVEKVAPEAAASPAENVPAAGPAAATGGTLVLDDEVVERLMTGLKAREAEKAKAEKEDTPYGRYTRERAAYEVAQPKCAEAQGTFHQRMASNEKLSDKYGAMVDKMVKAQTNGDTAGTRIYSDSAMMMMDPACAVKNPNQPDSYYDDQRLVHERAEQQAMKESGLSRTEYAQAVERVEMTLRNAPPTDLSASEKSAVEKRSKELKKLLGMEPPPEAARPKPAAAAAAPPPPTQPAPTVSAAQQAQGACYAQNVQKNEARLTELAQRAQAARQANDMNTMMAIADTIQRIQSAGCNPAN